MVIKEVVESDDVAVSLGAHYSQVVTLRSDRSRIVKRRRGDQTGSGDTVRGHRTVQRVACLPAEEVMDHV